MKSLLTIPNNALASMKKLSITALSLLMTLTLFAQNGTGEVYADDVSNTSCRYGARGEGVRGHTYLKLTRQDNLLLGELTDYYANCAFGKIDVQCEENDQTLNITVSEGLGEFAADCLCPINIAFTIHNATDDNYHLSLGGRDLGNVSFADHTVVVIDVNTLEQAYEEGFEFPVKLGEFEVYEMTQWIKPGEVRQPRLQAYYYSDMMWQPIQYLNYRLPTHYTYLDAKASLTADSTLVVEVITDGSTTDGSERIANLTMNVVNVETPLNHIRLVHRVVAIDGDNMKDIEVLTLYDGQLQMQEGESSVDLKELSEYRQEAQGGNGFRPMLKEGKTWGYIYHHFEEKEPPTGGATNYKDLYDESVWEVIYRLRGDTLIDGQKYMKMYRYGPNGSHYYGAFREDKEGRVWQFNYEGDKKDFMICDFTLEGYDLDYIQPIADVIKKDNVLLHRYHCNGFIGVEGVGLQGKGLVHYLFEPEPDCICDYESFSYVFDGEFFFESADFKAPKHIELTEEERQFVANNNDFAFDLFRKTRTESNMLLSPLSVTYALGMLNNGAAGRTQQEINQVLGFDSADNLNAFCRKMLDESGILDETTKVLIGNTIFVNEGRGYYLQDGFVEKANRFYDAEPQGRDFADGQTRDVINQWGSDHTEGMIKEVLSKNEFKIDMASYLLNALYFKGTWTNKFNPADTQDESFNGGEKQPMMHQQFYDYMYTENDLYQAIRLPYGNEAFTMTVFLPREGKTLNDLLGSLNADNWHFEGETYEVDLKLPRFETDTDQSLKEAMMALGMPTAFDRDKAEFPYFCNSPGYIDMMKQVAKIKVNEEGTEAAAVTIIGEGATSIPLMATFHANRPFFYIISERSTNVIFFMGQFTGSTATAIDASKLSNLKSETSDLYDLQGRKVSNSQIKKGVYIQDGKKVVLMQE